MSDQNPAGQELILETDMISVEQRQIFTIVNHVFLSGVIGLFGIVSNVINLIVFYRQGLNTTINISFFAMAVSDLCSLVFQEWYLVLDVPYFQELDIPMVYTDVQYLTGGVPHEMFARVTCLITAYITAERCLCIAFPLHVKQMITTRRTTVVIIVCYFLPGSYVFPLFVVFYLDWQFYPDRNRTILASMALENHETVGTFAYFAHGFLGVVSQIAVLVFTSILIRKLGQTSAWRQSVKSQNVASDPTSKRDRATMSMVVIIAIVLIICYIPAVLCCVTRFCEPEFAVGGRFLNLYLISWSFALLFETINSSVNIFFYYKMSSRFRQICREIMWGNGT